MIASQMKATSDPQDQWSTGTTAGCDGTLGEDKRESEGAESALNERQRMRSLRNKEIMFSSAVGKIAASA